MEEHNDREDTPTRRVAAKGVVMSMTRSTGSKRDTSTRVKYFYSVSYNETNP